jgi:hypothetical protein
MGLEVRRQLDERLLDRRLGVDTRQQSVDAEEVGDDGVVERLVEESGGREPARHPGQTLAMQQVEQVEHPEHPSLDGGVGDVVEAFDQLLELDQHVLERHRDVVAHSPSFIADTTAWRSAGMAASTAAE